MSQGENSFRAILLSLFIGGNVILGTAYIVVFFRAKEHFFLAEKELHRGNLSRAITLYNRSIRWFTPGNPYISASVERLKQIAQFTYLRGNWDLAVAIYQDCYSSLLSTAVPLLRESSRQIRQVLSALTEKLSEIPPPTQRDYHQKRFKEELLHLFSKKRGGQKKAIILFFIVIFGLIMIMMDHTVIFKKEERSDEDFGSL